MNRFITAMMLLGLLAGMCSAVMAAELLDVKPVVEGSSVTVEVTSDIPMTYTYYKIPGQARAVVDIADLDPEKIEALIVVNKGAVSSISVDKAQISGMVVSRLIFNLISEKDISVKPSSDRKQLNVTFEGGVTAKKPETSVQPVQVAAKQEKSRELPSDNDKRKVEPEKKGGAMSPASGPDDPLGLDAADADTVAAKKEPVSTSPPSLRTSKLEPAVAEPPSLTIQKIVVSENHIDILVSGKMSDFKSMKLPQPERIVIDIRGAKSLLKSRVVQVNKFGIARARVGVNPDYVRLVLDSSKSVLPEYTVTSNQDGIRVSFK